MKKKKAISVIILFGLALSSCKGCPDKQYSTLGRNVPALNLDLANLKKLINKIPDSAVARTFDKIVFDTASKFLEHGAKVINNIVPAYSDAPNRCGFAVCCYNPHGDGAAYYASVNASLAINLTEHIVAEVAKNINHCSYADKTHTAATAAKANASGARTSAAKAHTLAADAHTARDVREVALAAYGTIDDYGAYNVNVNDTSTDYVARAKANAKAADTYADVATEIAKKLGELDEFFNKWKK
ncbi:hypothetical protein AGMMS49936_11940 [Endomicrobiia bacterium]|nr:hypothetical protein AGMMS49936_11940 [Endomicrobiia bacterium]